MMPVAEGSQLESTDYKKKYKALKKKLKLLLYEHECFLEELRKSQRKLLKVSRDRSFLLDRLLQYENVDDSSSDSDMTVSSDSEAEGMRDAPSGKRKRPQVQMQGLPGMYGDNAALMEAMGYASTPQAAAHQQIPQVSTSAKSSEPAKKKAKVSKKSKSGQPKQSPGSSTSVAGLMAAAVRQQQQQQQQAAAGTMTREELERHLDLKQSTKPQYMSLGQAMNTLPDDIFGNEDSNQGGFSIMGLGTDEDDSNLIIDSTD